MEGLVRARGDDERLKNLPGILKVKECIRDRVPLGARRYLKTATVFGFHGVYRPLAEELDVVRDGIVGDKGYEILSVWEKEQGLQGFLSEDGPGETIRKLIFEALQEGMRKGKVVRSPVWQGWNFFGKHLFPNEIPKKEASVIISALCENTDSSRAKVIRFLSSRGGLDAYRREWSERNFHKALRLKVDVETGALLDAIGIYERFGRLLQDAFDDCLFTMTAKRGKAPLSELSTSRSCRKAHKEVPSMIAEVAEQLESFAESQRFIKSFKNLSEKTNLKEWCNILLDHHIKVQRKKPPHGKNPWFERFDDGSCVVRPAYRRNEPGKHDDSYVQAYRTGALLSFLDDLHLLGE